MKKILGVVMILGILAIPSYATDNITIPNTFNSGETISAAKMNENFQKLIDKVNKLNKSVYSDGYIIGDFWSFKGESILFKNSNDYYVSIRFDGKITNKENNTNDRGTDELFFKKADCSDQALIDQSSLIPHQVFLNSLYNNSTNQYDRSLWYTGNLVSGNGILAKKVSWENFNNCNSHIDSRDTLIEVYENDVETTGISSIEFTSIEVR